LISVALIALGAEVSDPIVCVSTEPVDFETKAGHGVRREECGPNLNWTLIDGCLRISGTGRMYNFGSESVPWVHQRNDIKSVVIEEGVTSVGSHAFSKCEQLTKVVIPRTVKTFDIAAFLECTSLVSVTIPDGVNSISDCLFARCSALESVTIPDSVLSIGQYAFNSCKSLKEVKLPGRISNINRGSFSSCDSLTSIEIPSSLEEFGGSCFASCSNLTSITVEKGSKNFYSVDGLLFDRDNCLVQFPPGKKNTSYTIPDFVECLGDGAFEGCTNLISVTIPDNITTIPEMAFQKSLNLKTVVLPAGLLGIDRNAFSFCQKLENIVLPDTVSWIGDYAFSYCLGLKELILPHSLERIGDSAFFFCTELKTVIFQENLHRLPLEYYAAFARCDTLSSVYYSGSYAFPDNSFPGVKTLKTVCVSPFYPYSTLGGAILTPDTPDCKAFQKMFNHCYSPRYVDGKPIQVKSQSTIEWENQTGVCGTYFCDNETGLVSWSECNSSENVSHLCMDEQCLSDWEDNLTDWNVVVEYENVSFAELRVKQLVSFILYYIYQSDFFDIGAETDVNGTLLLNVFHVDNPYDARRIRRGVELIDKGEDCKFGVLCRWKKVYVVNDQSSGSGSDSDSDSDSDSSSGSTSNHVIMPVMIILLVSFVVVKSLMN